MLRPSPRCKPFHEQPVLCLVRKWQLTRLGSTVAHVCCEKRNSDIPTELPVLPVKLGGVFLPGETKTLHIYTPKDMARLTAVQSDYGNLLATAVMEPHVGSTQALTPASFAADGWLLSCACLTKVLDVKPFASGGFLVRVRGEGRLAVKGTAGSEPFIVARVSLLCDDVAVDEEAVQARGSVLQDVMRDIQNMASKFRCEETARIQQATAWLHAPALVPIAPPCPALVPSGTTCGPVGGGQADRNQRPEGVTHELVPSGAAVAACVMEENNEALSLEMLSRLSFACLQVVPYASTEERFEMVQARRFAMESLDLQMRLDVCTAFMSAARDRLAAKIALMSV